MVLHTLAPEYLRAIFTRNMQCTFHIFHKTETDIRWPNGKSANGQTFFLYRRTNLWNILSAEAKRAPLQNNVSLFSDMITAYFYKHFLWHF